MIIDSIVKEVTGWIFRRIDRKLDAPSPTFKDKLEVLYLELHKLNTSWIGYKYILSRFFLDEWLDTDHLENIEWYKFLEKEEDEIRQSYWYASLNENELISLAKESKDAFDELYILSGNVVKLFDTLEAEFALNTELESKDITEYYTSILVFDVSIRVVHKTFISYLGNIPLKEDSVVDSNDEDYLNEMMKRAYIDYMQIITTIHQMGPISIKTVEENFREILKN